MERIIVKASENYEIITGRNILSLAGSEAALCTEGRRIMIVSDSEVFPLYGDMLFKSFEDAGFQVKSFIFEAGEKSKTVDTLSAVWEAAAGFNITRDDIFAALGGGVAGDLTGFAAASYMRGIKYINIPTSLLAMVDSSVGGKTAVNLLSGKNLAGAFYPPARVICDTDMLKTLKPEYFSDGMAEVIKYGMINSPAILENLKNDGDIENIIKLCIEDKKNIVEQDEYDKGTRQLLNFGHTAGHAIEKCSGYSISHGFAVAEGMVIITKAAVTRGICKKDCLYELEALLVKYSLPQKTHFKLNDIYETILKDKKIRGDKITLTVPEYAGRCVLLTMDINELYDFLYEAWKYEN